MVETNRISTAVTFILNNNDQKTLSYVYKDINNT